MIVRTATIIHGAMMAAMTMYYCLLLLSTLPATTTSIATAATTAAASSDQLKLDFYSSTCPKAEGIISGFVKGHIPHAPDLAAALLRLHFHDCFVRGCDGSVLLNSTKDNKSEKTAQPNLSLRGFQFIDHVKSLVEKECPGVVSCADILALAARDAIGVLGGPSWPVVTGRRDGRVSIAKEAKDEIPAPTFNFSQLVNAFAKKGLSVKDLVWLSGAHTIGIAHCNSFTKRLYNFTGKGGPADADPLLDHLYATKLRENKCQNPNDNTTIVEMDPGSFLTFDLGYYKHLLKHYGLFQSDAALLTDKDAAADIASIVNSPLEVFFQVFARSVQTLGLIDVKTGSQGEIRKHCAFVNS